jgi:hypothetical protein
MRIVLDPPDVADAFRSLLENLRLECRGLTATVSWRGTSRERTIQVNDRFGFWFTHGRTARRHWLLFGMTGLAPHPAPVSSFAVDLVPVLESSFPLTGFDRRMNGFFLRFGKDVLVGQAVQSGGKGGDAGLAQFLRSHGYDLTSHALSAPDAAPGGSPDASSLEAVILSSVSSPALAFNIFRFLSAVNDYRQWSDWGIMPGAQQKFSPSDRPPGAGGTRAGLPGGGQGASGLRQLVEEGVREQFLRHVEARKLRMKVGWMPDGDLALVSPDNDVLAAFVVETSLDPAALFAAVGRLILSRATLRAAKFLVVPGVLGAYFAQTLFRHDIHVATYKLTQDMAVVLDTDAVFKAIRAVG